MARLMFGACLALACDAARVAIQNTLQSDFLEGMSEEDLQWFEWGQAHIHPGTGEPMSQDSAPSSLMEEDAEDPVENPVGNILTFLTGVMLEPGSRQIANNVLLTRRRRSRRSDSFEGPSPVCPDLPNCTTVWAEEDGSINCTKFDGVLASACPVSCNTTFTDSYCIHSMSPCSDTISECKHGYRPRTACVEFFSYQNELHEGCKHGGPSGRRVWCPHTYNASTEEDQSESCDECTEVPVAKELVPVWEPVAQKLRCAETAVTVGDARERKYTFQNRGRHMNVRQPLASSGKWLGAVSLAAAVHRGFLEWDTLASDVFPWWTKDASDPRSRVSFRNMLNFVSGFYENTSFTGFTHNGFRERCLTWGFAMMWTPVSCAQQIYNQASFSEPGRYYDYNSYHLQLALGMVVQASGMEAREWLRLTLLEPAGMTETYWMGGSNPLLASGMMSTPNDNDKFLRKYLAYEILPKEIIDVVETEFVVANNVSTAFSTIPFVNYAMGHWIDGDCHTMGGMVDPCVNRRENFYIGTYKPLDSYPGGYEVNAYRWIVEDAARAVHASEHLPEGHQ